MRNALGRPMTSTWPWGAAQGLTPGLPRWVWALALSGACALVALASVTLGPMAAERPVFALALPLLLALGFMLVISPKGLLVAILLVRAGGNPVFEEARLAAIGGLGGLINLAVIVLAALIVSREPRRVPVAAYAVWLPFFLVQCVGLTYSPDAVGAARLLLGQLSSYALFTVAFCLVQQEADFDAVLRWVVASSVPVAAVTLGTIALGRTAGLVDSLEGGLRYGGPFPHANILAFYLVLVVGVLLYQWKRPQPPLPLARHALFAGYLLLLLGLLYFTKTRSAWLAAVALFAVFACLVQRRYWVYLLLGALAAMAVPELRERVLELAEGNEVVQYGKLNSFAWRQLIWADGLAWMSPSRYLLGYGNEAFVTYSPQFFSLSGGVHWGAHSVVVQLLFDLGVVGLAAYLWMFWRSWLLLRPALPGRRVWGVVFVFTLLSYLVVSLSDNSLSYLIFNWYFWLTVGAAAAFAQRVAAQEKAP